MRMLVVEDHEGVARALRDAAESIAPGSMCVIAADREAAFRALEDEWYDVIVCDRKLPAEPGTLETSETSGDAVVARAREVHPGTPILVLTAYAEVGIMRQYLRAAATGDPFGTREVRPLIDVIPKDDFGACVAEIAAVARHVAALDEIEVVEEGFAANSGLTPVQRRIVRLFARQNLGLTARVSPIGGGLSDTRTLKVVVESATGGVNARAFAKVGLLSKLDDEKRRYDAHIPGHLAPGAFAPFQSRTECGAGAHGGLFYTMADGYTSSLFDVLTQQRLPGDHAANAVGGLTERWNDGTRREQTTIRDVRRFVVSDDLAEQLGPQVLGSDAAWRAFEARPLQVNVCPQHGDLHCHNVLVDPGGVFLLIDYGDVRTAPACLDAIVLELSLLFHPKNVLGDPRWDARGQARRWTKVEEFTIGSPLADFICAARSMAHRRAAGQREVLATAYAFALRQFKFENTDHEIATAIIHDIVSAFE